MSAYLHSMCNEFFGFFFKFIELRLMKNKIIQLLVLILFGFTCYTCVSDSTSTDTDDVSDELTLLATFSLAISDPSGLALDPDGVHLWTVSDRPGVGIYKITLQGEIVKNLRFNSQDLEGIAVDPVDGTLWVVEERKREVVNVSREGVVLSSTFLEIPGNNPNDGLEGITIRPQNRHFYVLNEKNPRLLIHLDAQLAIQKITPIDFSGQFFMGDIAGIDYNTRENTLWILSDQSAKIVVTDLDGNPLKFYDTGVTKGEGIAVDAVKRLVYIVSDSESELYVFSY